LHVVLAVQAVDDLLRGLVESGDLAGIPAHESWDHVSLRHPIRHGMTHRRDKLVDAVANQPLYCARFRELIDIAAKRRRAHAHAAGHGQTAGGRELRLRTAHDLGLGAGYLLTYLHDEVHTRRAAREQQDGGGAPSGAIARSRSFRKASFHMRP
jgi:hypothetical protein